MSNVYYKKLNSRTSTNDVNQITRGLLNRIILEENIDLDKKIPLKVHFGEKGNHTYIKPENYNGIIDFLQEKNIETCYIETNALYNGQRHKKEIHLALAQEHGFNKIPIIIADGDYGESFAEVEINKKHYKNCKIGKNFLDYDQLIVLSHFKGHILAGFGGAIKQLSMGHAARGGKLAMHKGIKPKIKEKKCKKCNLCKTRCNENAIIIEKDEKSFIDHDKCVGCGACAAICPHGAISLNSLKGYMRLIGIGNNFKENLVEYAYAAAKGKKNIYINFAMNITRGCDCEPRKMKLLIDDIGVLISTDPVAIDKACHDLAKNNGKKFRGVKQLDYAEKIGLGSTQYELIEI
ncbi:MAG: DUF362 domain-containing protein [Candidatus Lokiarchaeota archaeon]|nr:DUF362 domain-containing protein [Candidatus Lokiarchaeota archaeon]